MKLSLQRYSTMLFFQFSFLLIDLAINSFSYLARGNKLSLTLVFLAQDVCLVLSYVILVFGLYSTYVYQAGVVDILFAKSRGSIWVLLIYLLLCVSHHGWILFYYERMPYSFQWPTPLTALYIIQRLFSPIYYYLYKRSMLTLSDPRFYENMEWINERLAIK